MTTGAKPMLPLPLPITVSTFTPVSTHIGTLSNTDIFFVHVLLHIIPFQVANDHLLSGLKGTPSTMTSPCVHKRVSHVWNDDSERKQLGTSTAHPALSKLQSPYNPSKWLGMLRTIPIDVRTSAPLGCVAPKPLCFVIGFVVLHASLRKMVSHRLILTVSILLTVCRDSCGTMFQCLRSNSPPLLQNAERPLEWSHHSAFFVHILRPQQQLLVYVPPLYCLERLVEGATHVAFVAWNSAFFLSPPSYTSHSLPNPHLQSHAQILTHRLCSAVYTLCGEVARTLCRKVRKNKQSMRCRRALRRGVAVKSGSGGLNEYGVSLSGIGVCCDKSVTRTFV